MKSIVVHLLLLSIVFTSPYLNSSVKAQDSPSDEQSDKQQPDDKTNKITDIKSEKQSNEPTDTNDFVFTHFVEPSKYADNASFYYELTIPKNAFDCKTGNGSLEVVMTSDDGVETKGSYAVTLKKCITKKKWGEGKFIKCKKYKLLSEQDILKSSSTRTRKLPQKGSIIHLKVWDARNDYEKTYNRGRTYAYKIYNQVDVSTKSGYPIFPAIYEKGKGPKER